MQTCKSILSRVRRLAGLKQYELAERLGVTHSTVAQKEGKSNKGLSVNSLIKTLEALDVKARLVVEFEDGHKETFRVTEK